MIIIMGFLGPSIDQLKEKRDIQGLITLLKTGRGKLKGEAAWALGEIQSSEAVPALIEALKNKDERCRAFAAWALGNIKDTKATQPLLQALTDPKNEVRAYVSWALGNMEAIGAIPDLERLSNDSDEDVKKYAIEALEKIKSSTKYQEYQKKTELEAKRKQQETARTLLDETEKLIKKLTARKIITPGLEETFLSAQEAFDREDYTRAAELAQQCKTQADKRLSEHEHKILQEKNKAFEALEAVKKRREELLTQNITTADELLLTAENYYNAEEYQHALEAINQWNQDAEERITQKKAEAEAEQHFKELDETLKKAEKLFIPLEEDPKITKALQNKQYLEYAKKYKQQIEEFINRSSPTLTLQLPAENYKVDYWTKVETQLTNTGSTIAQNIHIQLSADIDYKISPLQQSLSPHESTTLLLGIKPLAPGDLPVEIIITYTDGIDREYEQRELTWIKVQETITTSVLPLETLSQQPAEPAAQAPIPESAPATPEPPAEHIPEPTQTAQQETTISTEPEITPDERPIEVTPEPVEHSIPEPETTPTEEKTVIEPAAEIEPQPATSEQKDMGSVVDMLNDIGMKGMGNAATMVSQMAGQEIEADQPELKTIPREDIQSELEPLGEQIATVSMRLSSMGDTPMSGAMYMHFSAENGFKVADLLFNNPPGTTTEYNELSISTLKEAANIFGGQYLSAISEYIGIPIIPTTPDFQTGTPAETAQSIQSKIGEDVDYILATELHFGTGDHKIKGELLIMFDNTTFELLLEKLYA